ncbi:hypothetical protein Mkiyose1665_57030 [Mycobacterium kiyosense]|uniref:Uncharacterized protein n=1 Tax=Mycobacterium kiyosense TaxID=2871094 RepID=A0A9P3V0Y4_9MYCO|nr:hypothetical protein IWGMT90018_21980 [Mycobacterium kiyosense]BDE14956.1 hypothetical protein MKCMC460_38160 [Mycobacterium sp. 20KCMC460]GLB82325.1 hypothetical protein SRL2020028_15810 [Mycobacterium kiyosense]GLB89373.1 hypothetical protein SRL2020130_21900 [Mycobacterium kiyosense]GLB98920.1 hypothetical protein SRL2020226_56960 [Mycobacterium kiyosense]
MGASREVAVSCGVTIGRAVFPPPEQPLTAHASTTTATTLPANLMAAAVS